MSCQVGVSPGHSNRAPPERLCNGVPSLVTSVLRGWSCRSARTVGRESPAPRRETARSASLPSVDWETQTARRVLRSLRPQNGPPEGTGVRNTIVTSASGDRGRLCHIGDRMFANEKGTGGVTLKLRESRRRGFSPPCRSRGIRLTTRRRRILPLAPLAVMGLAACGAHGSGDSPTNRPLATAASTPTASSASGLPTVDTTTTSLGTVLTDAQGHTLYYLSAEQDGQDTCSMQPGCLVMWPALAPPNSGDPTAGSGVHGTLGVITAADGGNEVTYNSWPLHTFADDAPGQANGQLKASFGGVWYVATPAMALAPGAGEARSLPGLQTPTSLTSPPGALPTNPFAATTPPAMPAQPTLPGVSSAPPSDSS